MLGLRGANKSGILFAVVLSPVSQLLLAMPVAQGIEIFRGHAFGGAVAQGIERYRSRSARKRIAVVGSGKHWPLAVKPKQVAEKNQQHEHASAHGDADLCAGESHPPAV